MNPLEELGTIFLRLLRDEGSWASLGHTGEILTIDAKIVVSPEEARLIKDSWD